MHPVHVSVPKWLVPSGRGCSLGSTTQPPLSTSFPKPLGQGGERDLGAWETVGEEGCSQLSFPPGSGNGHCGKQSEKQFSPATPFVIYAGQLWVARLAPPP